jgi:hypothetical protein
MADDMTGDSPFLLKGYKTAVMVNAALRIDGRQRAEL